MKRVTLEPRPDWQKRLEGAGCYFHTIEGKPYWNEVAAYEFTADEIDRIEAAANELHAMCMEHVNRVADGGDYEGYGFPDEVKSLVEQSVEDETQRHLYGRFDLGYDGKDLKLFEYNADTPTALPEASVWQYHALQDRGWPDQFNSIHEALVARWPQVADKGKWLHFAAQRDGQHEDWGNLHYLMETATEAGFELTASLNVEDIGWKGSGGFVDMHERPIGQLFKLYPWEWMMADEFGWKVREAKTHYIEPAWKMLLSTKALLPLLWKKHSGHPLLLPAYFEAEFGNLYARGGNWVKKPLLGREGANVTVASSDGKTRAIPDRQPQYDKHGYILQEYFPTQTFPVEYPDGKGHPVSPVLGAWVIGDEPAGLGIREDIDITTNASQFVPHYFVEG